MNRLNGKRVLITAAGNGIGRACTIAAHSAGAHAIATDIDEASLASLRDEIGEAGIEVHKLDCTDQSAVEAFARSNGSFDVLIHCVGYVHHGDALRCTPEEWHRSFQINVDSFLYTAQAVLPGMREAGGGSVVCISSIASSLKGLPNRAAYGATKGALNGLVKSIAADYVGDGIRCNAVCPGTISTPSLRERMTALGKDMGGFQAAHDSFVARQPMNRIGTAEEVASMCIYLAGDDSAFVTGQLLAIDGGISI